MGDCYGFARWRSIVSYKNSDARRGFTLVELLVVIAIIGILVALLLPAVQAAREAARRAQCQNKQKQIGLALQNYHTARNSLPMGSVLASETPAGKNLGTWVYYILPYLEEQAVYDSFNDLKLPMYSSLYKTSFQTILPGFICPSDPDGVTPLQGGRTQPYQNPVNSMGLWYPTSMGPNNDRYCVYCPDNWKGQYCCLGPDNFSLSDVGMFRRWHQPIKFRQVSDGLSNTFMLGETLPTHCAFNGAYNANYPMISTTLPINTVVAITDASQQEWWRSCGYKSLHSGGSYFTMGDGSVHFVNESIDLKVYYGLGTRAGEEVASIDQ